MKLSLPPKLVKKLVWVPVISFCKFFIASYAFDALLCWNWPFWPPNHVTFRRTPISKVKKSPWERQVSGFNYCHLKRMELWGVRAMQWRSNCCCWASFSTSHPPSLLHLIICCCCCWWSQSVVVSKCCGTRKAVLHSVTIT
jgi:hypothetical protein